MSRGLAVGEPGDITRSRCDGSFPGPLPAIDTEVSDMLMPTVSVTVIGLTVGVVGLLLFNRGRAWRDLLRGLVGAWLGFLGGALAGIIMDVMLSTGVFVALVGHGLAVLGALVA